MAIYTKIIQPNPDFSFAHKTYVSREQFLTEKYKFYLEINVKKGFESCSLRKQNKDISHFWSTIHVEYKLLMKDKSFWEKLSRFAIVLIKSFR